MRVVVNYKKTQKTVVRVSPHVPLQEIVHIISSKCDFDPLHTVLLKTYQSRETLDLTKSLNVLGLRELYAMDVSKGKAYGLSVYKAVAEKYIVKKYSCKYITFFLL